MIALVTGRQERLVIGLVKPLWRRPPHRSEEGGFHGLHHTRRAFPIAGQVTLFCTKRRDLSSYKAINQLVALFDRPYYG